MGSPSFPRRQVLLAPFPSTHIPISNTLCCCGSSRTANSIIHVTKSKQLWSHSPGVTRRPWAKSLWSEVILPSHLTMPSQSLQKIHYKQCRSHGLGEGVGQFFQPMSTLWTNFIITNTLNALHLLYRTSRKEKILSCLVIVYSLLRPFLWHRVQL